MIESLQKSATRHLHRNANCYDNLRANQFKLFCGYTWRWDEVESCRCSRKFAKMKKLMEFRAWRIIFCFFSFHRRLAIKFLDRSVGWFRFSLLWARLAALMELFSLQHGCSQLELMRDICLHSSPCFTLRNKRRSRRWYFLACFRS